MNALVKKLKVFKIYIYRTEFQGDLTKGYHILKHHHFYPFYTVELLKDIEHYLRKIDKRNIVFVFDFLFFRKSSASSQRVLSARQLAASLKSLNRNTPISGLGGDEQGEY